MTLHIYASKADRVAHAAFTSLVQV
jgi:hypothetical protein